METQFSRTELVLGGEAMKKLASLRVIVFGLGGVGGYIAEALVRSGVGALDLVDNDVISLTNLNRQLLATHKTLNCYKVDVAEQRIKTINPECVVHTYKNFYLPDSKEFDFSKYDYIADAIDTISGKIGLVLEAKKANVPIISAMGAGNKLDPTLFEVTDIYKTSVCPLCHVMRKELRKRGVEKLKVVYSKEKPLKVRVPSENDKKNIPGSIAFVPPVVGFIMAGEIVKDLIK